MYKPTNKISTDSGILNKSDVKIPTRAEMRLLRNPVDLTAIDPYNENAIIPFNDAKSEDRKSVV